MRNLTYPIYDYTVKKAEQEAKDILEDARQSARSIVADAEKTAVQIASERKKASEDLAASYEAAVKDIVEEHKELLNQHKITTESLYKKLEQELRAHITTSEEMAKTRGDSLKEEVEKQISAKLEKELEAARRGIEEYRRAQKRVLDKKLIELVERVVAVALQRTLSVKDHEEYIKKELEEARKDHIF